MNRIACSFASLALLVTAAAAPARADDHKGVPGTKGTVTAYADDGKTVIDSEECPRQRLSYDYPLCGKILRARVKESICSAKGKGSFPFMYQIGDGKPAALKVFCAK